jgi:pyruvate formate lyase activating enzyme
MKGRIHSLETFGTLDGPGIRFVLFMQGCAMQCQYCHNPDSWDTTAGRMVEVEEIMSEIEPYLHYYRSSGGGITVTGGEPALQAPFLSRLLKECKKRWGLHTTLDTSGFCEPSHLKGLMEATDLVLLDLKQMNPEKHIHLTGQSNERILKFAASLSKIQKPVWIRHVLVPGLTDDYADLFSLGQFIGSLNNVERIEILPYHRMGVYKWQQMNKAYPLEDVTTPTDQEVVRARSIIDLGRSL